MNQRLLLVVAAFLLYLAVVGLSIYTGYEGTVLNISDTQDVDIIRLVLIGVLIIMIVIFLVPPISMIEIDSVHFTLVLLLGVCLFPLAMSAIVRLYGTLNFGIGVCDFIFAVLILAFSITDLVLEVQRSKRAVVT